MPSSSHRPAIYVQEHANPHGPGDARPTALQIVNDEDLVDKLAGKVALITGCSSGIGVETARAIHATGADTFITARDVDKAQSVVSDIRRSNPLSKGKLEIVKMELDNLSSVREGATDFLQRAGGKLNILICNAGVMACPYTKTVDGLEQQFGVCHIAHFLLFQLVKQALLSSASVNFTSRVVILSSSGHRGGSVRLDDPNFERGDYNPWSGYGQAKTANIWMANEIERRYGSKYLHATSVMPGMIMTPLLRHASQEQHDKWQSDSVLKHLWKDPAQGASTTVWAAIGKEWSDKGAVYLENCAVAELATSESLTLPGYSSHAFDQNGAKNCGTCR